MNIKIVGRKVNLRENFKELVQRKLSKFDRIFDEDADATVTVTLEKNRQTVEIMIKQRGMLYRAEATAPEMNEALDDVVAALGNQIRRNKKRLERAQKMKPVELPDTYYDTPDEEDEPEIAKRKTFYVKVMTVEEAILQMEMLGHTFFMYRDGDTGEIDVVYKRRDGKYGVLAPRLRRRFFSFFNGICDICIYTISRKYLRNRVQNAIMPVKFADRHLKRYGI